MSLGSCSVLLDFAVRVLLWLPTHITIQCVCAACSGSVLCAVSKKGQDLNNEIRSCTWILFEITGCKASKASKTSQWLLKEGDWLADKTLKTDWL